MRVDSPVGGGAVGDVGVEVVEVVWGEVPEAKEFDAGGVDDFGVEVWEGVDSGGRGGVFAFVVDGGDVADADVEVWSDESDEGGLADAGVTGEDGFVSAEDVLEEGFGAFLGGTGFFGAVAEGTVVCEDLACFGEGGGVLLAKVDFVEADDGFEGTGAGGEEHAVDEAPLWPGESDGDDDHHACGVGDDGVLGEGLEGVGAGEDGSAGLDAFDHAFLRARFVTLDLEADADEVADDGRSVAAGVERFADGAEDGAGLEEDLDVEGEDLHDPADGEQVDVGGLTDGAEFGGVSDFAIAQGLLAAVEALDLFGVEAAFEELAGEVFFSGTTFGHEGAIWAGSVEGEGVLYASWAGFPIGVGRFAVRVSGTLNRVC